MISLAEPMTETATGHGLEPFADNVAFLEAKADEATLLLERAAVLRDLSLHGAPGRRPEGQTGHRTRQQALFNLDMAPDSPPSRPSLEEINGRLEALRVRTLKRLDLSNPEDIPFFSLVRQFDLDPISQDVIWLLFFNTTSPDFRQALKDLVSADSHRASDAAMAVGEILCILCPGDYRRQLAAREVFSANKPLLGRHLLRTPYGIQNRFSILELDLVLAGRIIQWISGDRNEYAAELPFVIERPATTLDQVVLPDSVVDPILKLIGRHGEYVELRKRLGMDSIIEYGRAVVILEYGPPGTGKTLLARAISNYTGRPLVSLPLGESRPPRPGMRCEPEREELSTLFREAQLQGGIVFIDECEDVCGKDSHVLKEFLIELEKSDALVIMTTNRPEVLPPAMDRRITLKVPFEVPTAPLRRRIWELLLAKDVPLADDVDVDRLARSYPLAGGYIKNAVQTALNLALYRSHGSDVRITQGDLDQAARLQERQIGRQFALRDLCQPRFKLADCVVTAAELGELDRITHTARNYPGVMDCWGWKKRVVRARSRGFKVLFFGQSFQSAREAAEAVAGELSVRINKVHLHHVIAMCEPSSPCRREKDPDGFRIADVFAMSADSGQLMLLLDERQLMGHIITNNETDTMHEFFDELAAFDGTVLLVTASKSVKLPEWASVFHERLRFGAPDFRARSVYWRRALDTSIPLAADADPAKLAAAHDLGFAGIQAAVHKACLLKSAEAPQGELDAATIQRAVAFVKQSEATTEVLFG